MDRSPSPHHLESLNQEDKVASRAGEGVGGTGMIPFPITLLDLPDELLVNVFDQVWQEQRSWCPVQYSGLVVPLSKILINKRTFSLAYPLWYRELATPTTHEELDPFLSWLVTRHDIHPMVQAIETDLSCHLPLLHSAVVTLLSNLTSLTLSFADEKAEVHAAFRRMLKSMTNLRRFRLVDIYPELSFAPLSLNDDLPSLRQLDAVSQDFLEAVIDEDVQHLDELIVRSEVGGGLPFPWSTLRTLRLCPTEQEFRDANDFVEGLESAIKKGGECRIFPFPSLQPLRAVFLSQIRLEYLELGFDCVNPAGSNSLVFNRTHFWKTLELLQASRLKHLKLTHLDDLSWLADQQVKLPTVQTLSLSGPLDVWSEDTLAQLHTFLGMFPSLTLLSIEGFSFGNQIQSADAFSALSSLDLALRNPPLAVLLKALQESMVMEMRFKAEGETREMRWTRRTVEEEFVGECWTLE